MLFLGIFADKPSRINGNQASVDFRSIALADSVRRENYRINPPGMLRPFEPIDSGPIYSEPMAGGLHHRYYRRVA
jgi:hypothetical protein